MKTIHKIIDWLASRLGTISTDKLLHFIAGSLLAAFFALVIPCTAKWCIVFVLVLGGALALFDLRRYKKWSPIHLACFVAGGMIVQLFAWL